MTTPLYCHWVSPPFGWTEGALIWYVGQHFVVRIHYRYADGSITYALTPLTREETA